MTRLHRMPEPPGHRRARRYRQEKVHGDHKPQRKAGEQQRGRRNEPEAEPRSACEKRAAAAAKAAEDHHAASGIARTPRGARRER